jgi:hypothetical protein
MVENMVDDGVEPKPAKIEASDEASGVGVGSGVASDVVKPNVNVKLKVKIPFQAHIGHIEEKHKQVPTGHIEEKPKPKLVPTGVRGVEVYTGSFLTTNERWREREYLLGWVRRQVARAEFTISIDKSSLKRSHLTMQRERSDEYKPHKTRKKPNLEGTISTKCECPFRLKCFFDKDTQDLWNSQP